MTATTIGIFVFALHAQVRRTRYVGGLHGPGGPTDGGVEATAIGAIVHIGPRRLAIRLAIRRVSDIGPDIRQRIIGRRIAIGADTADPVNELANFRWNPTIDPSVGGVAIASGFGHRTIGQIADGGRMAIINKDEARIAIREDGRIVFEVPLDGRRRKIVFEPDAALQFGTVLANAGFDAMPKDPGLPTVTDLHLKPFDDSGMAALRLTLKDFGGPAAFLIDAHHLLALSEAARGALELAQPGGRA